MANGNGRATGLALSQIRREAGRKGAAVRWGRTNGNGHHPSSAVANMANEDALADAIVALAARRFWPHVKIEELAQAVAQDLRVDLSPQVLRAAVQRRLAKVPRPTPAAGVEPENRRRRVRGPGRPPSDRHVWCSYKEGHWVLVDLMARNKARPGGLADWCLSCFDDYRKDRAAQRNRSLRSPAASR